MIEPISKTLAYLLEKFLGSGAIESVVEILVFLTLTIFVWFIDPLSMRFRFIRKFRRHEEKYCGKYVQIIQSGADRRYSLIDIFYNPKLRKYILSGKQYDAGGHPAIDFKSDRVFVVEDVYHTIEFSWVGGAVNLIKEKYEGFTKMIMTDAEDIEMLDGHGFFITFDEIPRRVNLQFVKMSKRRLSEFGLLWPKKGSELTSFVLAFHNTLQVHPELEPIEESKKPLVI